MLFISICSSDALQVPKVLQVVEETKRIRHKAGNFITFDCSFISSPLADKELYQYVLYDTATTPTKGPKIINLDDRNEKGKGKNYTPPSNIVVHLSKIDMPELRPRNTSLIRTGEALGTLNERTKDGKTKESRKDQKEREKKVKESSDKERKEMKKREKERAAEKTKLRSKSSSPALASHISPHPASTSLRPHAHPYQSHSLQPSHSPSRFNSPVIYSAPPLPPRMPTHHLANRHSHYATYPVPSHNHHSSNQHHLEPLVSPPPPPPPTSSAKLLDKLLWK